MKKTIILTALLGALVLVSYGQSVTLYNTNIVDVENGKIIPGMTVSRLAPMGKVEIGGKIYEAKSMDSYIDPRREVEVVGFENFNIIVRKHIK